MPKVRDKRWAFRVESETAEFVRHAAATADVTLTDFVVSAAVVEAEHVMADRTRFTLPADKWAAFVEILDRSPHEEPGLEKLFSRPSVFTAWVAYKQPELLGKHHRSVNSTRANRRLTTG
jgi:uncharacterized protein (DUF1778 family)